MTKNKKQLQHNVNDTNTNNKKYQQQQQQLPFNRISYRKVNLCYPPNLCIQILNKP